MRTINWITNPWDLTESESSAPAPLSGAPNRPLSDRAKQILAKPASQRTDAEKNQLLRKLEGKDKSISGSRLQESRISSIPKSQGKSFSPQEMDMLLDVVNKAQDITAEMLKGIREGDFHLTETALQQVAESNRASMQLTQAVLTQQKPQFLQIQRANFQQPYPRQRNWLRNEWGDDSNNNTQNTYAFIIHAKRTTVLNGKIVDGESGDFILYKVKCEIRTGNNSQYINQEFYMFEQKSKQEGAEIDWKSGGSKNLSPNALLVGLQYELEWIKMNRTWANGKNSIHIKPGYSGHSNLTYIHPASYIYDLAGCKGLCFDSDLGIEDGKLKVKGGFRQSGSAIVSIYEAYDKLKKEAKSNVSFRLSVEESIYQEVTPVAPNTPPIIIEE